MTSRRTILQDTDNAPEVRGVERVPRAILFDWDNTLVESWTVMHHALHETMRAMGSRVWSLEEVRRMVQTSVSDAFPALFGARAPQAMDVFYNSLKRMHMEKLRPAHGAETLLRRLRSAFPRMYLAVISNKCGDFLRREVAHLGWGGYFSRVVGSGDAAHDKPHPAPVLLALSGGGGSETAFPRAPSAGEDVWIVGDSAVDLLCAHKTGCVPVLLRPREWPQTHFAGKTVAHRAYFPSIGALLAFFADRGA